MCFSAEADLAAGVVVTVIGVDAIRRARELAAQYGPRFEPPASLVERAERNEPYLDGAAVPA